MATNFITNTASLKTTVADVRKLNAKKIFLGGEDILDLINSSSSTPTIKHATIQEKPLLRMTFGDRGLKLCQMELLLFMMMR